LLPQVMQIGQELPLRSRLTLHLVILVPTGRLFTRIVLFGSETLQREAVRVVLGDRIDHPQPAIPRIVGNRHARGVRHRTVHAGSRVRLSRWLERTVAVHVSQLE
jgi:hypothetical protein